MKFHLILFCALLTYAASQKTEYSKSSPAILSSLYQLPVAPAKEIDAKDPEFGFFEQELDHSDPQNSNVWNMKYASNDQFYVKGGPLFVFIGGLGPLEPQWLQGGQMFSAAKRNKGHMFYVEHRFYGESKPTKDASTSNLKYLTAGQALADVAHFISYQKGVYNATKVIVFGGGYSGNLAAWGRQKYPHLIDGAIAASAPVKAYLNFKEYYEVVGSVLKLADEQCYDTIKNAIDEMQTLVATKSGAKKVTKLFNLCNGLSPKDPDSIAILYNLIAEQFAKVVQNAKPGDVQRTCLALTNSNGNTPLEKLAQFTKKNTVLSRKLFPPFGCINLKYSSFVSDLRSTSWKSAAVKEGSRQWLYQTCTEFGYLQTSDSENQPFGSGFPVSHFIQRCKDVFGKSYNENSLTIGIVDTNIEYGGLAPVVNNVFYLVGTADPWFSLEILQSISKSSPSLLIQGSSHCAELYAMDPTDTPQLVNAKMIIQETIAVWLY